MIDDPNLVLYQKGSRAQILAKQFAESYQTLLSALNRTFNGSPGFLKQSIGLMYSLDLQARELMQTPSGIVDGATATLVSTSGAGDVRDLLSVANK